MSRRTPVSQPLQERWFHAQQPRMLVYNACCEDPAIDCAAMRLAAADRVLVITSGGCNALAYLLAGAGQVHAVDLNPCQNALLELKAAALQHLDFAEVWELFGAGRSHRAQTLYRDLLRSHLTVPARRFWDRRLHLFRGPSARPSFYHHGGWGLMMWFIQRSWRVRGLYAAVERLFSATSLSEQWDHYAAHLRPYLWPQWFAWLASRPLSHALLGIPPRQRQYILTYPGGLHRYGQELLDDLVARIPFSSNYFMHVNALGRYHEHCCPEYLTRAGFGALQGGLLGRLSIHTSTVTEYLRDCPPGITKFVLLDHLDWLDHEALQAEWQAIVSKAAPGATILFRSALQTVDYLDDLPIVYDGWRGRLGELLTFDRERAAALHQQDRVHLYGSFSIARLPA